VRYDRRDMVVAPWARRRSRARNPERRDHSVEGERAPSGSGHERVVVGEPLPADKVKLRPVPRYTNIRLCRRQRSRVIRRFPPLLPHAPE